MANEFAHKSVGASMTQAEYESIGGHVLDSQAIGDIVYATSTSQLSRLGIGATGGVLIVTGGVPAWDTSPTIPGLITAGSLTVTGTTTLNGNLVLGDAATDTLAITSTITGGTPLVFEGATADGHETSFVITDPTADRTITFADSSITVNAAADISGATLASNVVTSSLTTVGVLNAGSINTSFGTINNNAAITGTAVTGTSIVGGTVAGTTGTFTGVLDVTDATDASDATGDTGALRTEGGASIAKKLYVGTDVSVGNDLTVTGDLTVSGTTTTVDSTTVAITDSMLLLAKDQGTSADAVDFGFYGKYGVEGTAKYAGIFRDGSVSGDPWTFFDTLEAEPGTEVNTAGGGYDLADISAGAITAADASTLATGTTIGNLTLANGSITDSSGAIDFGNETLTSTGVITAGGFTIGSAAILEAELEILDGATVTTGELNLLDGDTSVGGSITLANGDGFVVNDGGVMKTIPASDVNTYVGDSDTTYSAGDGLDLSGTTFSTDLMADGGLEITSTELSVAKGISEHDVAQFAASVADDDFLRINGTAVEGLSAAEVAEAIEDSIDAVGTIAAGVWNGTAIANGYLANSAVTITAGAGMTGGGSTALGASSTLNVIAGSGMTVNAGDIAITADQTTVTSIYNAALKIGRDTHNQFDFATDNAIKVSVNAVDDEFRFVAGGNFHADADVFAYSSTTASDRNIKKNIVEISDALSKVKALHGVTFDYKEEHRGSSVGLIAQDVQALYPELVTQAPKLHGTDDETYLSLNYNGVIGLLVEAVKELAEEVRT